MICRRDLDRVRVFSRGGNDWTDRAPRIADGRAALNVMSITIVRGRCGVCRRDGVSDFDLPSYAMAGRARATHSCTRSICLSLTGTTCAEKPGRLAEMHSRACYATARWKPTSVTAFGFLGTLTRRWRDRVPARVPHGSGGRCRQTARPAISVRAFAGLGEDHEPEFTGGDANLKMVKKRQARLADNARQYELAVRP